MDCLKKLARVTTPICTASNQFFFRSTLLPAAGSATMTFFEAAALLLADGPVPFVAGAFLVVMAVAVTVVFPCLVVFFVTTVVLALDAEVLE